ncbi:ubiquitin carboxyl-terminal hydrolase [Candidatus Protochlamydia phocaeensis]|uniref:ubiquitin carboxyl-terminal hydrolase n=1 Tax=Candidatus Protochlamydia phocaeensis TaxID=1414722 RepID=UPI000837C17F|nr:ubiquitin carboxyl-terminal hydrolase family protein [Candidatus Protochlamydia phocaeensis]
MKIKFITNTLPNNYSIPIPMSGLEETKTKNGRTYALLGRSEKTYLFGQRAWHGIRALAKTVLTLGIGLLFETTQSDWKVFWTGKKVAIIYKRIFLPFISPLSTQAPLNPTDQVLKKGGIQNGGNSCYMSGALQWFNAIFSPDIFQFKEIKRKDTESEEVFELKKQAIPLALNILEKINQGLTISGEEVNSLRRVLIKKINLQTGSQLNQKAAGYPRLIYGYLCDIFDIPPFYYERKRGSRTLKITENLIPINARADSKNENHGPIFPLEHLGNDHYRDTRDIKRIGSEERPEKLIYELFREENFIDKEVRLPLTIELTDNPNPSLIESPYHLQGCLLNTGHVYVYLKEKTEQGWQWVKYDDEKVSYNIPEEQVLKEASLYSESLIYSKS